MIRPWRVLRTRDLVKDRWITLRADVCETGRGHVLDPWYMIDRPDWVTMAVLTPDRQAVLTREYRHAAGVVADGLPGGVIEPGEAPEAAAARELAEETGYVCDRWVALGAYFANWRNQTSRMHLMLGLGARPLADRALDEGEDIEVVLTPWTDWLQAMLAPPAQASYVAASLLAERRLAEDGI